MTNCFDLYDTPLDQKASFFGHVSDADEKKKKKKRKGQKMDLWNKSLLKSMKSMSLFLSMKPMTL